MQRESFARSMMVAVCLCLVCSVVVSSAAVILRPLQEANKQRQMQKDILKVAGRYEPDKSIKELFEQVETRLVDLSTGQYVDPSEIDPQQYDPRAAAKDPERSVRIPEDEDLAGLKRREKYAPVYLVRDDDGQLEQVILPVRGKGLWSTMYGFLSLDTDLQTVQGITFYEHGETPGLGGEIDNPKWQAKWEGKIVVNEQGEPEVDYVRGEVSPSDPEAEHKIDGLAGATITTRGVTEMVRYWLGDDGFGPYLEKRRDGKRA